MAKRINQEMCIQCAACLAECPNGGIEEIDAVYMIDPKLCTECAGFYGVSRCLEVCPVDAVEDDPDHQEEAEILINRAANLHPGYFPAD